MLLYFSILVENTLRGVHRDLSEMLLGDARGLSLQKCRPRSCRGCGVSLLQSKILSVNQSKFEFALANLHHFVITK